MKDTALERLHMLFRRIWIAWASTFVVAIFLWVVWVAARSIFGGLLLGLVGGAYVIYSMIRQGHLRDGLQGRPLYASGMLGMVTRLVVLIAVLVVALKGHSVNPYATFAGYFLGFIFVFVGLFAFARGQRTIAGGK